MLTFFSFLFLFTIMWVLMWAFFKFMYPKPPKAFMPKLGDIITPRECDYCNHPLAEYRGVLERKPLDTLTEHQQDKLNSIESEIEKLKKVIEEEKVKQAAGYKYLSLKQKRQAKSELEEKEKQLFQQKQAAKQLATWFYCNYEHQAQFHAERS